MADEAPTPDAPVASTDHANDDAPDTDDTGGWDDARYRKVLSKKNQEAKSLRDRLKELEPLAEKARELEDASKSETQRLTDALDVEKRSREAAELKLLRFEVGAEKGVPPHLVRFLTGSTKEEIGEAADVLVAELGNGHTNNKPSKTPGKPPERVAGGTPANPDDNLNPLELIRKVREGRM